MPSGMSSSIRSGGISTWSGCRGGVTGTWTAEVGLLALIDWAVGVGLLAILDWTVGVGLLALLDWAVGWGCWHSMIGLWGGIASMP